MCRRKSRAVLPWSGLRSPAQEFEAAEANFYSWTKYRPESSISEMPYEFTEWEPEPEPKPSSSRTGGPPRKITGIGILDPPSPPKRQGPILPLAGSFLARIFAAVILIGIVGGILLLLLQHR
jgi:hypothetical protein